MDKTKLAEIITNHPKFKKLTTDPVGVEQVAPTTTVYYKSDEDFYVLFKYLGKYSHSGARYAMVHLLNNTYENTPSKVFTDFWMTKCDSYKAVRITF